jgi:glyoxylase-like metal-dependent hydrolase (beta-lactamase superfamily II)
MMARLSFLYPRRPINVGPRLLALPSDGRIRELPGWQWHHTPGHTPGHVALFRPEDRLLVAGDAVVTTRQESAASVLTERPELRPPPAYYTIDWPTAETSVRHLATLQPEVLVTGHGAAMRGEPMRRGLDDLIRHFRQRMPRSGWYLSHPVHPEDQLDDRSIAPDLAKRNQRRRAAFAVAGTALVATALTGFGRHHVRPARTDLR